MPSIAKILTDERKRGRRWTPRRLQEFVRRLAVGVASVKGGTQTRQFMLGEAVRDEQTVGPEYVAEAQALIAEREEARRAGRRRAPVAPGERGKPLPLYDRIDLARKNLRNLVYGRAARFVKRPLKVPVMIGPRPMPAMPPLMVGKAGTAARPISPVTARPAPISGYTVKATVGGVDALEWLREMAVMPPEDRLNVANMFIELNTQVEDAVSLLTEGCVAVFRPTGAALIPPEAERQIRGLKSLLSSLWLIRRGSQATLELLQGAVELSDTDVATGQSTPARYGTFEDVVARKAEMLRQEIEVLERL